MSSVVFAQNTSATIKQIKLEKYVIYDDQIHQDISKHIEFGTPIHGEKKTPKTQSAIQPGETLPACLAKSGQVSMVITLNKVYMDCLGGRRGSSRGSRKTRFDSR